MQQSTKNLESSQQYLSAFLDGQSFIKQLQFNVDDQMEKKKRSLEKKIYRREQNFVEKKTASNSRVGQIIKNESRTKIQLPEQKSTQNNRKENMKLKYSRIVKNRGLKSLKIINLQNQQNNLAQNRANLPSNNRLLNKNNSLSNSSLKIINQTYNVSYSILNIQQTEKKHKQTNQISSAKLSSNFYKIGNLNKKNLGKISAKAFKQIHRDHLFTTQNFSHSSKGLNISDILQNNQYHQILHNYHESQISYEPICLQSTNKLFSAKQTAINTHSQILQGNVDNTEKKKAKMIGTQNLTQSKFIQKTQIKRTQSAQEQLGKQKKQIIRYILERNYWHKLYNQLVNKNTMSRINDNYSDKKSEIPDQDEQKVKHWNLFQIAQQKKQKALELNIRQQQQIRKLKEQIEYLRFKESGIKNVSEIQFKSENQPSATELYLI